jgi:rare lipoprotein A (peptidoglycan hydrolase)
VWKGRIIAAATALSVLTACTPDAQDGGKADRLVAARAAPQTLPQLTPWMTVMMRFDSMTRSGSASEELEKRLLDVVHRPALARAETVVPGDASPRDVVSAAAAKPQLENLAVRVARKLGDKLARAFAGRASFYSSGARVASGDIFIPEALTAAHKTLPFGTRLRVTDAKTGRSVVVIVNDRGPYAGDRVLDLSLGAARVLGMTSRGVIQVHAEVI